MSVYKTTGVKFDNEADTRKRSYRGIFYIIGLSYAWVFIFRLSTWDEANGECRKQGKCLFEVISGVEGYSIQQRIQHDLWNYGALQIHNFFMVALRMKSKVC